MGLLSRRRREQPPADEFRWEDVVCGSKAAAEAEAEQRQLTEDPAEVEWIYLHSETTGQWLARRTPRRIPPKTSWWEAVFEALLGI